MPIDGMNLQQSTQVTFLYTSDRERALGFYRDTLGLALHSSDPHGDFFGAGGALVRMTVLPDYKPHEHPVLGWNVEDIVPMVEALRDRGVECLVYEGYGQDALGIWTAPDGSSKMAWFADPDGNLLMLNQG